MLGEKVGTFTGTTTDKAMPAQGGFPSFETSAQTSGKSCWFRLPINGHLFSANATRREFVWRMP